jgi:hypothetical protein
LQGGLTGSSAGEHGEIASVPSSTAGDTNLILEVDLSANASYTVEVGGTSVGTITTGSNGEAFTTLNNIASASITADTTVTIVDSNGDTVLSGTFNALSVAQPILEPVVVSTF